MSYELRGFATGQTLLADDLNHMESGIAAACTQAEETAAALEAVKSRVGLSAGVKNALLECFSRVAWTDESGLSAYVKLQNAMDAMGEPSGDVGGGSGGDDSGDSGGEATVCRVTYQLLGCDADNRASVVIAGRNYVTQITALEGYEFYSASVTVDGVTTEAPDGLIIVNNVQTDIVVTAVATVLDVTVGAEAFMSNVSAHYQGVYPYYTSYNGSGRKLLCPSSENAYPVKSGASYTATLTYDDESVTTYKWSILLWEKNMVDAKADAVMANKEYIDSGWKTTQTVTVTPNAVNEIYYIGAQLGSNSSHLQSVRIQKGA